MSGTGMTFVSRVVDRVYHLASHQGFKRYFANTSWLFAEKVLRMVIGLFVGVWVARYLGPEKYGLLSYAQSFVGLFTAIATLGLDGIVVRELVKDESRRDELLGTAFWLKVIGGIGVLVFVTIAVNFTSNDWYTNFIIFVIASGTVFQAFNVVDMYFQAKVMGKYIAYVSALSLFAGSLFRVYLIISEAPLVYFAWAVVFDSVVLALGYVYFYVFTKGSFRSFLHFRKSTAISLLKDSWPLIIASCSFVIFSNVDNIMIKEIIGEFYVGIYKSAYQLVTLWYFLPGLLLSSLMPSLVSSHRDLALFNIRILHLSTLLVWIAIFIFLIYNAFGKLIIEITYGQQFIEAVAVLNSLAAVNLLIFYNSMWNYWMMIENRTKRTLLFHLFTAFLNVVLNYFFIFKYGVIGASYALLMSLLISYLIFSLYDKRILQIFIDSLILKVLWGKK